jgi:hypothetical protein
MQAAIGVSKMQSATHAEVIPTVGAPLSPRRGSQPALITAEMWWPALKRALDAATGSAVVEPGDVRGIDGAIAAS